MPFRDVFVTVKIDPSRCN